MKITERKVLITLISHSDPISINDLSSIMNCDSETLSCYLESLISKGLVRSRKRPFNEKIRFSPKRFDNLYFALPTARDYVKMLNRDFLMFLFTAIAALMATLTLIVTIFIPFFS